MKGESSATHTLVRLMPQAPKHGPQGQVGEAWRIMAEWQMWLFGAPHLVHRDQNVPIQRRKQWALLTYLLLGAHPFPRELLAALLWPAYGQAQALADLRRELSRLHHFVGQFLWCDRNTLAFVPNAPLWVDVLAFDHHYTALHQPIRCPTEPCPACYDHLVAARALYTNDLLAGFSLSDCPDFEEWLFFQQETLRNHLFEVLKRLSGEHILRQDHPQAIAVTRELLAIDPLYEEGQRRLIWLYTQTGQRSAALRQYQSFAQQMAAELHTTPSAETAALLAQIATEHGGKAESP